MINCCMFGCYNIPKYRYFSTLKSLPRKGVGDVRMHNIPTLLIYCQAKKQANDSGRGLFACATSQNCRCFLTRKLKRPNVPLAVHSEFGKRKQMG